jgi:hypothetical protein
MVKFQIGDRVRYRGAFGGQPPRMGTIIGNDGEKNDQVVYDVDLGDGDHRWGYANQFTLVQKVSQP